MTISVYLTIALTIERWLSIVKPLIFLRHKWVRSSLVLATPAFVFSILFTLPNYFMLSTVQTTEEVFEEVSQNSTIWQFLENENVNWTDSSIHSISIGKEILNMTMMDDQLYIHTMNSTVPAIEFASWRHDKMYITVYVMWSCLIVNSIIPFTILVVLNTAVYRKLVSKSSASKSLTRHSGSNYKKREMRLARISLLIVLIFFICHSVKIIPSVFEIVDYHPEFTQEMVKLNHLLIAINCGVNFLVYYLASGRKLKRILTFSRVRQYPNSTTRSVIESGESVALGPRRSFN